MVGGGFRGGGADGTEEKGEFVSWQQGYQKPPSILDRCGLRRNVIEDSSISSISSKPTVLQPCIRQPYALRSDKDTSSRAVSFLFSFLFLRSVNTVTVRSPHLSCLQENPRACTHILPSFSLFPAFGPQGRLESRLARQVILVSHKLLPQNTYTSTSYTSLMFSGGAYTMVLQTNQ